MSKLDKLIKELCPDGVEYKRLGEIGTSFYRGSGIKRDDITPDGIPCVRYGEIYTTYHVAFSRCISHTQNQNLAKSKFFSHGDILFAITGESVADIAKSCAYLGNEDCLAGGDILVMKHEQNPKYIAYALETNDARKQKSKGKIKSKVVHASVQSIKDIVIPVPPLEVQSEIVKILDNFTELTTELTMELTTELTARKKQYEYYRNRLLTFDMNISEMKLSDVCDYVDYRGKTPVKSDSGVFLVTAKNIKKGYIDYDSSKEYIPADTYDNVMHRGFPQVGDVLITTEAPCGNVAQVDRADIALAQRVIKLRGKTNILRNRYLKFILLSQLFQDRLMKAATGSTVKGIKGSTLLRLSIPVPSLDVQDKIADVLDNFDKVCNDLHIGLPAEIEARKKQYEFYRDSLLTFLEKGGSILTDRQTDRTEVRPD